MKPNDAATFVMAAKESWRWVDGVLSPCGRGVWACVVALWVGAAMGGEAWGERLRGADALASVPLMFEAVGEGRFVSRLPGFGLHLAPGSARMVLAPASAGSERGAGTRGLRSTLGFGWIGFSDEALGVGLDPVGVRLNYFVGRDPLSWRTNVAAYGRVRYADAYPGIDMVFYGNDRQLEYDFVVRPGADPGLPRARVEGAESIVLTAEGDLLISVGGAEIRQRRPVGYQVVEGEHRVVPVEYELGVVGPGTFGFRVGEYDRERTLVIDPVVVYAAYFGGSAFDLCRRLAVGVTGRLVLVGETASLDLPVTNALVGPDDYSGAIHHGGPPVVGDPAGNEAFVAGFSADGRELEFATYLGGSQLDAALDVAVDAGGNLLVVGLTQSPDFPVVTNAWSGIALRTVQVTNVIDGIEYVGSSVEQTNAWPIPSGWRPFWTQEISGAPYFGYYPLDAFLTILTPAGDAIRFSGYLGGQGQDQAFRVAAGSGGRVYLAGLYTSTDFPLTRASIVPGNNFVVCLDDSALVFSVAVDVLSTPLALAPTSGGGLWVAGETRNAGLPGVLASLAGVVELRSYQTNLAGGADAFLARLGTFGVPDYLSYLGGSLDETAMGLLVNPDGGVTVAGYTASANFPTHLAISSTNAGVRDFFVTRLDGTLTNLVFSTYLGGSADEELHVMRPGVGGSLLLAGWTQSADFLGWAPVSGSVAGTKDGVVVSVAGDGSAVEWSARFGGTGNDEVLDVGLGVGGMIWLTGRTQGLGTNWNSVVTTNWWSVSWSSSGSTGELSAQPVGFLAELYPGEVELAVGVGAEGEPVVHWPAVLGVGYELEVQQTLGSSNAWSGGLPSVVVGTNRVYRVTAPEMQEYFRLRQR
jgi:hypothetical protein